MIVDIINNEEKINNFLFSQPDKGGLFLQSWYWGEFQRSLGRKIWRLGLTKENNGELIGSALIIKNSLPLGYSYFYCPRGPIFSSLLTKEEKIKLWDFFIDKVKKIAQEENIIFFRFEPVEYFNREGENPQIHVQRVDENFNSRRNNESDQDCACCQVKKAKSVQPDNTLVLDLAKSEEELLNAMKPKTRYNIRLAERKGVKIRISDDQKEIDDFYRLIETTYHRSQIKPHAKSYYQKQFEILNKEGLIKLLIAEYREKILVANLIIVFGKTATYVHGGSSDEHRNLMAPHLAQWMTIKYAKEHGCSLYDFWGIAPDDNPKHPWAGVTRFKQGFGGRSISYPGAFDLFFQKWWYKIYQGAQRLKNIIS